MSVVYAGTHEEVGLAKHGSRWALGAALALVAGPALAHSGTGLAGGFISGVLHPLSGPDHLLAMVAVGLWGAFLGRPLIYILPMVFPAVMAIGGVLGMANVPLPPVEIGIAISVLVLGGAIAIGLKAPVWAASAMVAVFAIFHGYAHGQELPSAADPIGYSVGFVLATGSLHVVGILLGQMTHSRIGRRLAQGLGGAIAVAGVYFLYNASVA